MGLFVSTWAQLHRLNMRIGLLRWLNHYENKQQLLFHLYQGSINILSSMLLKQRILHEIFGVYIRSIRTSCSKR